jgi:hypothetical protein
MHESTTMAKEHRVNKGFLKVCSLGKSYLDGQAIAVKYPTIFQSGR